MAFVAVKDSLKVCALRDLNFVKINRFFISSKANGIMLRKLLSDNSCYLHEERNYLKGARFLPASCRRLGGTSFRSYSTLSRNRMYKFRRNELKYHMGRLGLATKDVGSDDILENSNSLLEDITNSNSNIIPERTYILQFDGGSRGNPGVGGAGMALFDADTSSEVWNGQKYLGDSCTNNEAEYSSILIGLTSAHELGVQNIVAQGDSQLIIKQLNGEYKVKSPNLKPYYEKVKNKMKEFVSCQVQHIPRDKNARADQLANEAMDSFSSFVFTERDNAVNEESESPVEDATVINSKIMLGKTYILQFDGGSRGNPGIAGAGMVLYDVDTSSEVWHGRKYLGESYTNNEAEYSAILVGLDSAQTLGIQNIVVQGDSELIVKQLKGEYKVKSPNLKPYYDKVMKKMNQFASCLVEHIPRAKNARADNLANRAMDYMDSQDSNGIL